MQLKSFKDLVSLRHKFKISKNEQHNNQKLNKCAKLTKFRRKYLIKKTRKEYTKQQCIFDNCLKRPEYGTSENPFLRTQCKEHKSEDSISLKQIQCN